VLEAAIVTIFCQRHQAQERVRIRIRHDGRVRFPQPKYSRSMIDKQPHLKSLQVGRWTSKDEIMKVLREHFPDADNITLVEA